MTRAAKLGPSTRGKSAREASAGIRSGRRRRWPWILGVAAALLIAGVIAEVRTSWLQARLTAAWSDDIGFVVEEGASPTPARAAQGPYDRRLGYAALGDWIPSLEARGFEIEAQARVTPRFERALDLGLFPIYREKTQAGLTILDRSGEPFYTATYPERRYPSFDAIPPIVVHALLFIENRELLDPGSPYRNPAIEWDRLAGSILNLSLRSFRSGGSVAGASTLATQIEKFRHSPGGFTSSVRDKLRQMASATVRAYSEGLHTEGVRRRIVLDYLNSVPLAAVAGHGEVIGLQDGLWAWYGLDADRVNAVLARCARGPAEDAPRETGTPADAATGEAGTPAEEASQATFDCGSAPDMGVDEPGTALRAVLSLLLAQRRPSFYLARSDGREALQRLTDAYLGLLAEAQLVEPALASATRSARLDLLPRSPERPRASFIDRKAAAAVRTHVLGLTGWERLYDLDRLDLTVHSTIDHAVQDSVTRLLTRLEDRGFVQRSGLAAERLLGTGDPRRVLYSFVLYELTPHGSLVRVQTDNFDAPLDLNQSSRLELGSSAKLRALVTYLEVVERLYGELAEVSPAERRAVADSLQDPLTRWVAGHLDRRPDSSLRELLDAAMERTYSASSSERFFTGGGSHVFRNFDARFEGSVLSVRQGFRNSVNLVFVRIMRDLERFYRWRVPGASARILNDPSDPRRQVYLERFADREGGVFVSRFFNKFRGKSRDEILASLVGGRRSTPLRLGWAFRSVLPDADVREFELFLRLQDPNAQFSERVVQDLFRRTDVARLTLADQGYLASIHPLELWVARHLIENPDASRDETLEASQTARRDVYQWLFSPRRRAAQDRSISVILELEAFLEIQRAWRRLGYPFENLVPSYGTAIGSSGDRPSALAELVGILLNDGIRQPAVLVDGLRFAAGTPFETRLRREASEGVRVLSSEVAAVAREALLDVVTNGTARSVLGSMRTPDGTVLPIGGKTGTGNNQFKVFASGGRLVEARTINRTATFVFFIGDRHYGVITAHVPGPDAAGYSFTSALPVRVLALLASQLTPLFQDL